MADEFSPRQLEIITELGNRFDTLSPRQQEIYTELSKRTGIKRSAVSAAQPVSGTAAPTLVAPTPTDPRRLLELGHAQLPGESDAQYQARLAGTTALAKDTLVGSIPDLLGAGLLGGSGLRGGSPGSRAGHPAPASSATTGTGPLPTLGKLPRFIMHLIPGGGTVLRGYDAVADLLGGEAASTYKPFRPNPAIKAKIQYGGPTDPGYSAPNPMPRIRGTRAQVPEVPSTAEPTPTQPTKTTTSTVLAHGLKQSGISSKQITVESLIKASTEQGFKVTKVQAEDAIRELESLEHAEKPTGTRKRSSRTAKPSE